MRAPCPDKEIQRLAALRSYRVLDTGAEEPFDRLTRLAARLLRAPICLVSLVDEKRQFFKSCVGLGIQETPRDVAFCAYTILTDEPMVVEDALEDERFRENRLVLDGVLRSYAGAPLVTSSGHRLGSLCVLDTKPRSYSADDLETLSTLASVVMDELELRVSMERLERALEESRRADAIRRAFINNISHEIRTPLTAIIGFAEMIAESDAPVAERRALSQTIRGSCDRLLGVIDDVLDFARLQSGDVSLASGPLELGAVVRRSVESMRAMACQRGVRLESTTPHDPVGVLGDEGQLRQAVERLIEGVIRHGGSDRVEIELLAEPRGGRVQAEMVLRSQCAPGRERECERLAEATRADADGPGMPAESISLGISIVKRLAQLMGGRLAVTTKDGQMTVRLSAVFEVSEDAAGAEQGTRLGPHQLDRLRVLVVEDGPDNQLLLRMLLEKAGALVEVAGNGREALAVVDSLDPQVILMDLQMPVMDGFETTRRLRAQGFTGPIIAVTANATQEDRRRCELAGFDFFLSKPVRKGELYERCAAFGRTAA